MRSVYGLVLAAASALWACGGDVRVDGEPGSGGQGGAGSSSTSSSSTGSTTPTTSSGPMPSTSSTGPQPACDCFQACDKLSMCFGEDIPCDSFCNDFPPEVTQCVCNEPSCAVEGCFGGTGGSGGSGGGPPDEACEQCLTEMANGPCNFALEQCANDTQCLELLDCHTQCGWTFRCNQKCDATFPAGYPEFVSLINCAACGDCYEVCSQSSLINYCFDG